MTLGLLADFIFPTLDLYYVSATWLLMNFLHSPTCTVCFHFCSRASNMTLHSSWTSCCCHAKKNKTKSNNTQNMSLNVQMQTHVSLDYMHKCQPPRYVGPHPHYCPSQSSVLHQWSQLLVSYWFAGEQTIFAAGKGYWWLDPPQTLQTPSWKVPKALRKINIDSWGILTYELFHKPDFLLVECISEFWSHEQSLQKAVQIAGHSLVDQTNITWIRVEVDTLNG